MNSSGDEQTIKLVTDTEQLDKVLTIKKSDIEVRKESKVSLMPLGLLNTLEPHEILDLMAYVLAAGRSGDKAFNSD